jgi:hypothetical protein
MSVNAYNCY